MLTRSLATAQTSVLLALCGALGCARIQPTSQAAESAGCAHDLTVLSSAAEAHRTHALIARVSTSCARARDCERQLRERACELQADALILETDQVTGEPTTGLLGNDGRPLNGANASAALRPPSQPSYHARTARAVRWTEPGEGAFAQSP